MLSKRAQVECSINTPLGVKVPDVVWYSDKFFAEHGENTPYDQATELCVEVVSPSNSRAEMEKKIQLYFEQGAQEVWLCNEAGQLEFFSPAGPLEKSVMFPDFPQTIK